MPTAYEGNKPYIFVSYSHKDKDEVLRYVDLLEKNGFRVWFDGGVEVGSEWPEYIANHLASSACVMAFVSKNFVDSENCRRELALSQELKKGQMNIYIKNITKDDLPMGMRLQLGLNQALFRANFDSENAFITELTKAKMISDCRKPQNESTVEKDDSEPYIFINYAHKDRQKVKGYVSFLRERGFRVWMDDGSFVGDSTELSERIQKSACMLSFVSPAFAQSVWCQKELDLAIALKLPQLTAYIQNATQEDLPMGMRLRLGLNQALFRANFATDTDFVEELAKASIFAPCRMNNPKEDESLFDKIHRVILDDEEHETDENDSDEVKELTPEEKKYAQKGVRLGWLGVILEILWTPLTGYYLQEMVIRQIGWFWIVVNLSILHTIVFLISKIFFKVLANKIKRQNLDPTKLLENPKIAIWLVSTICSLVAIFVGVGKLYTHMNLNYFVRLIFSLALYALPAGIPFIGYLFLDE